MSVSDATRTTSFGSLFDDSDASTSSHARAMGNENESIIIPRRLDDFLKKHAPAVIKSEVCELSLAQHLTFRHATTSVDQIIGLEERIGDRDQREHGSTLSLGQDTDSNDSDSASSSNDNSNISSSNDSEGKSGLGCRRVMGADWGIRSSLACLQIKTKTGLMTKEAVQQRVDLYGKYCVVEASAMKTFAKLVPEWEYRWQVLRLCAATNLPRCLLVYAGPGTILQVVDIHFSQPMLLSLTYAEFVQGLPL